MKKLKDLMNNSCKDKANNGYIPNKITISSRNLITIKKIIIHIDNIDYFNEKFQNLIKFLAFYAIFMYMYKDFQGLAIKIMKKLDFGVGVKTLQNALGVIVCVYKNIIL